MALPPHRQSVSLCGRFYAHLPELSILHTRASYALRCIKHIDQSCTAAQPSVAGVRWRCQM